MSKIANKYDFAYAVGVIRVLETFLLSENEVERMVLAMNAPDAFRILNESDYADNKAGINNPADFQKVLDEGLMDIKENLDKITPNRRVLRILWYWHDFHNIKVMVKGKLGGKSYDQIEPLLNPMGAIPIESLKSFIYLDTDAPFLVSEQSEKYIKNKIKKIYTLFEKEKRNPLVIDLYFDQKMMKMIYNIAHDSKNEFLIKYVQKLIDMSNIKLFFRMKAQGKDLELYDLAFLWNGTIPFAKFKDAYKHDLSDFPDLMKSTPYSKIIAEGYKHFEAEKTLIFLEKLVEDHLTLFIREAKLTPFGPEPLIAYFLAKRNNALVMRMILINKLNNIEPEEIRTRLRKIYS